MEEKLGSNVSIVLALEKIATEMGRIANKLDELTAQGALVIKVVR